MNELRYSVLFDGVTLGSIPDAVAKARLAAFFMRDPAEFDDWFPGGGGQVVVKRGLSAEEADSFIRDLRQAGVITRKSRDVYQPQALQPLTGELALVEEPSLDRQKSAFTPDEAKAGHEPAKEGDPLDSPANFWGEVPNASAAGCKSALWSGSPDLKKDNPLDRPAVRPGGRLQAPIRHDYCDLSFISFQGRIGRIRFIGWAFGGQLIFIGGAISFATLALVMGRLAIILGIILVAAALIFFITLSVRRLHDLNRTGWWLLIPVIWSFAAFAARSPVIMGAGGILIVAMTLLLYLMGGSISDNDYGPPPPPNGLGVTLLAVIVIILDVGSGIQAWRTGINPEMYYQRGRQAEAPWSVSN